MIAWSAIAWLAILPIQFLTADFLNADQPTFEIRQLTVDANEGIAAGDIDGDGVTDLVSGRSWYRGGDFVGRPLRIIEDWNGYVQSNGDFLRDINRDGRLDVLSGSYLPTEVHWYENPGDESLRLGKLWPRNLWVDTGQSKNEGQLMVDLDGDGTDEWIVNSWDKKAPMTVWRFPETFTRDPSSPDTSTEDPAASPIACEIGPINGHGLAIGDLNGDGRDDIAFGLGWYEQPRDPWQQPWKLHADWELHASIPMLIVDVDNDGDNDLIHGAGHNYGLFVWFNEGVENSEAGDPTIRWRKETIDDSFSQVHALAWADIDGDGSDDLIAGKRYYAHNGKDPGGENMPCLYYYTRTNGGTNDATKSGDSTTKTSGVDDDAATQSSSEDDVDDATVRWTRHVIEEGHVGCGLQIVAEDLDGDQDVDLAVAGKSGTYVILNQSR